MVRNRWYKSYDTLLGLIGFFPVQIADLIIWFSKATARNEPTD
jgi:hypothetical protein